MARLSARRMFALLHAWIGALAACFVLLLAITGLAIAFSGTLFELQYPEILKTTSREKPASQEITPDLDAMYASAVKGYGKPIQLIGLLMPGSRIDVDAAMFYGVQAEDDEIIMLGVDPVSARYTGSFHLHDAIGHDLIDLHSNLLADEAGQVFIAGLGFLLSGFALSGLYLWWPRNGSVISKLTAFRMSGFNIRSLFRLHGLMGVWAALLILYFSLTGTMHSKPDWFGQLLDSSYDVVPREAIPMLERKCVGSVTLNEAHRLAASKFPDKQFTAFEFDNDKKLLRLRFKGADDLNQYEGDGIAWVHSQCSNQIAYSDTQQMSVAMHAHATMFSLHSGRSFGWFGTLLVCITCLMLIMISLSGIVMWWRMHRVQSNQNHTA
jgi:uncharacterized iron-regulated membrane protein